MVLLQCSSLILRCLMPFPVRQGGLRMFLQNLFLQPSRFCSKTYLRKRCWVVGCSDRMPCKVFSLLHTRLSLRAAILGHSMPRLRKRLRLRRANGIANPRTMEKKREMAMNAPRPPRSVAMPSRTWGVRIAPIIAACPWCASFARERRCRFLMFGNILYVVIFDGCMCAGLRYTALDASGLGSTPRAMVVGIC